jgi:O-antigen/teichoic acid export membrane protein
MGSEMNQPLSYELLLKQILLYAPGKILPAIISLTFAAIFTRIFSTEAYGLYSLLLGTSVLLTAVLSQWLQQATNRYLPSVDTKESLLISLTTIGLGNLCIVITTFILLVPTLLVTLEIGIIGIESYLAITLFVITGSLFGSLGVVLQAMMKVRHYTVYNILKEVLRLSISIIIVLLIHKEPSSLIWAAGASGIVLIPFMWKLNNMPSPKIFFNIKFLKDEIWSELKKYFAYGLPLTGWFISAVMLNVGDRYIIQFYRGSAEVGIYSASYYLIQSSASLVAVPVLLAAHPFLMRAWKKQDVAQASKWLGIITTKYMKLCGYLTGVVYLFSKEIASILLGNNFYDGYQIMPIVFLGACFWQIGMYTHKPLEFHEKTKIMLYIGIIVSIINIGLNFILIPDYGYIAAAYTTLISYILYCVITSYIGMKYLRWSVNTKEVVTSILLQVLFFSVLNYLKDILHRFIGASLSYSIVVTIIIIGILYSFRTDLSKIANFNISLNRKILK